MRALLLVPLALLAACGGSSPAGSTGSTTAASATGTGSTTGTSSSTAGSVGGTTTGATSSTSATSPSSTASSTGTSSTSSTTAASSSSGTSSSTTGTTGGICAACTADADCASGRCTVDAAGSGFCDSASSCAQDSACAPTTRCEPASGSCVCPPFPSGSDITWPVPSPNSGAVLGGMTLVTLVAANDTLGPELLDFSDALAQSSWWTAVTADYGVAPISRRVRYTGPAITTDMSTAQVVSYIQQAIADGGAPGPDGDTLYLLYLPGFDDGGYAHAGTTSDCAFHNGYPSTNTSLGDGRAVVTHACTPATYESQVDAETKAASHEIIEAATDPTLASWSFGITPAEPWTESVWASYATDKQHVEVGDVCEGTRISESDGATTWAYQRSWSVSAAAGGGDPCVPHRAVPYYDVVTPADWYPATAGTTLRIPLIGRAQTAVGDWLLRPHVTNTTPVFANLSATSGLDVQTTLGNGASPVCSPRPAMNQDAIGEVSVDIPAAAQSGDYAVVTIHSFREDSSCSTPLSEDLYHLWAVGVYIP